MLKSRGGPIHNCLCVAHDYFFLFTFFFHFFGCHIFISRSVSFFYKQSLLFLLGLSTVRQHTQLPHNFTFNLQMKCKNTLWMDRWNSFMMLQVGKLFSHDITPLTPGPIPIGRQRAGKVIKIHEWDDWWLFWLAIISSGSQKSLHSLGALIEKWKVFQVAKTLTIVNCIFFFPELIFSRYIIVVTFLFVHSSILFAQRILKLKAKLERSARDLW